MGRGMMTAFTPDWQDESAAKAAYLAYNDHVRATAPPTDPWSGTPVTAGTRSAPPWDRRARPSVPAHEHHRRNSRHPRPRRLVDRAGQRARAPALERRAGPRKWPKRERRTDPGHALAAPRRLVAHGRADDRRRLRWRPRDTAASEAVGARRGRGRRGHVGGDLAARRGAGAVAGEAENVASSWPTCRPRPSRVDRSTSR